MTRLLLLSSDWSLPPVCHAADQSEAAGSAEAELQAQEGDGRAARCVRHQEAVAVRLEEDTGETGLEQHTDTH